MNEAEYKKVRSVRCFVAHLLFISCARFGRMVCRRLFMGNRVGIAQDLHLIRTLYNGIIAAFLIQETNHDVYKSDNQGRCQHQE